MTTYAEQDKGQVVDIASRARYINIFGQLGSNKFQFGYPSQQVRCCVGELCMQQKVPRKRAMVEARTRLPARDIPVGEVPRSRMAIAPYYGPDCAGNIETVIRVHKGPDQLQL